MNRQTAAQTHQQKPTATPTAGGLLQRKCACGNHTMAGSECAECGKAKRIGLQTKLNINEPGDIYEQEADRIADQVLATPAVPALGGASPRIQRFSGQSNGQMDASPASVDQALASPGKPLDPALQQDMGQRFGHDFSRVRVHSGEAAGQSAREVNKPTHEGAEQAGLPLVNEVISSPGQPLDAATRAFFEPRFGHDFSQVRVHADERAAESARAVQARAYTVGEHVVFGAGEYASGSEAGKRLLAHELVHTVQQKGGMSNAPPDRIQRIPVSPTGTPFAGETIQGGVALRGTPHRPTAENPTGRGRFLANLPRGHRVTVKGGVGWISVTTSFNNRTIEGFISHELLSQITTPATSCPHVDRREFSRGNDDTGECQYETGRIIVTLTADPCACNRVPPAPAVPVNLRYEARVEGHATRLGPVRRAPSYRLEQVGTSSASPNLAPSGVPSSGAPTTAVGLVVATELDLADTIVCLGGSAGGQVNLQGLGPDPIDFGVQQVILWSLTASSAGVESLALDARQNPQPSEDPANPRRLTSGIPLRNLSKGEDPYPAFPGVDRWNPSTKCTAPDAINPTPPPSGTPLGGVPRTPPRPSGFTGPF